MRRRRHLLMSERSPWPFTFTQKAHERHSRNGELDAMVSMCESLMKSTPYRTSTRRFGVAVFIFAILSRSDCSSAPDAADAGFSYVPVL